jgi:DivIVA domain-containing protein
MALTPNDVLNKQFETTKFRDGYDQDQVDDFLDEVLAEFQRLIAENDQLKSQLGSAPSAAPADSREADSLRAQLEASQAQLTELGAQLAESQQALQTLQQQAANQSTLVDGMNSAEYLQLARRVHEEHVREGVAKRDELIAEGEAKSATLLVAAEARALQLGTDSQAEADALIGTAREQAETLVADAQAQHDTLIGALNEQVATLSATRDGLQTEVDGLKEFERTYRESLKTYLETQLAELTGTEAAEPEAAAWEAPAVEETPSLEDTSSGAVEFSESFEVPPVVDDEPEATTTGGVAWSGFAVDTEAVDTGSPFDSAAFGNEPGPVTYEIPGYSDAPSAEGDEGQQPPAAPAPGFGGF